jgi:uncharacterized protein (DUF58 family)
VENYQKYLDPKVLARLEGFRLTARRSIEGYVSGVHHSIDRGLSIEFAEHRDYAPGDDLRYLDWKVYGRTDKYYLKQFEEETNLVCYVLLDISRSMQYRSADAPESKLDYARRLAATLSYLVLRQQDSVSLVTFDDKVGTRLAASGNPSHLKEILQVMDQASPVGKTAVAGVFHELAERFKRRGIVIIVSDLLDDVDAMLGGLAHFRHRRHEVILLHVLDSAEIEFPFDEPTLFCGLEHEPPLLVEPRALRKAYLCQFDDFTRRLQQGCRARQIDYAAMRTDRPVDAALSAFLGSRR